MRRVANTPDFKNILYHKAINLFRCKNQALSNIVAICDRLIFQ